MQKNDNIFKLIEQAASSVNMLSSADTSETEDLRNIFNQINRSVAEITDVPANILDKIIKITSEENILDSIESISKSVSSLQGLIDQIYNTEHAPVAEKAEPACDSSFRIPDDDIPLVLDFIAESNEHIESAESGLLDLEARPDDKDLLNLVFRAFHTIKGMAGFLNLSEIGSLAHSAENLLDLARKDELKFSGDVANVVFESIDMMKKMIGDLKTSAETGNPLSSQKNLSQLLKKIKDAAQSQKEGTICDSPQALKLDENPQSAQIEPLQKDNIVEQSAAGADTAKHSNTSDDKIKVSTARLDELINMAGELVIAQLMVSEEASQASSNQYELNRKIAHQGKIVRNLQELSMSMRMVPIAGVFQKMARLVRDLAQKSEKQINFVTHGEETELDRNIVDKISDPLVHMIRNSVDHGIEIPQNRKQAGKDQFGQIKLSAFHKAGNIVIEIEDDGNGLNKERILQKAIESGIVDANQQLPDDQIYKLIFHAGLSTAQKITDVSGRGVGMDVVKKNIESLRGKIDITSTQGKGTLFSIRLPLTLAMIDGQVVKVGDDRYIIPINSIIGTIRPQAEQISSVYNQSELVMIRGQLLPLIRLNRLFGINDIINDPTQSLLVIIEDDRKKCCLLVDDLLNQQQVVIKTLSEGLGTVKGVSGSAIMGDGKVSLILDVPGIIKLSQS